MPTTTPRTIQTNRKKPPTIRAEDDRIKTTNGIRRSLDAGREYSRLKATDRICFASHTMSHWQSMNPSNEVWNFTLQLSDKLVSKTKSESPKESIERFKSSIKRSLKRATGKDIPPMWFVIETKTKDGIPTKPHLHGAIIITSVSLPKVRKALRGVAGGRFAPNNAVSMKPLTHPHDAQRWALYCLKNDSEDYVSQILTKGTRKRWDALLDYKGSAGPSHKPAIKPPEPHTRPTTESATIELPTTPPLHSKPSMGRRTLQDVVKTAAAWHEDEQRRNGSPPKSSKS